MGNDDEAASDSLAEQGLQLWQSKLHRLCAYVILAVLVLGPVFLGVFITVKALGASEDFVNFILQNYAVFFILPYVGCLAYFIVVTVENTRGPIEIELATIKLKGAGGPILFWVVVFVVVTSVIKMFWNGYPQ
ncbi:hypothetical protein FAZ69_18240 [Trinickia terrae]|uniref:Uncharacterized protein n=1 Tax=Trinickia terrae TaxID=2571161 RepID=A0A4U1I259_9BURK|nr:hypothetical protein [Trinickia terrae]TKC87273.1 hypothetical protein FAZ69_18240 [Trinickia terrae]